MVGSSVSLGAAVPLHLRCALAVHFFEREGAQRYYSSTQNMLTGCSSCGTRPPAYAVEPLVVPNTPAMAQQAASMARARDTTSPGGCGAPASRAAA